MDVGLFFSFLAMANCVFSILRLNYQRKYKGKEMRDAGSFWVGGML